MALSLIIVLVVPIMNRPSIMGLKKVLVFLMKYENEQKVTSVIVYKVTVSFMNLELYYEIPCRYRPKKGLPL